MSKYHALKAKKGTTYFTEPYKCYTGKELNLIPNSPTGKELTLF